MPGPYSIALDPRFGTYNFDTDQGLTYACKFSRITSLLPPIIGIYDIDVHEFMFYPYNPDNHKGYDPRVSKTLENLALGYFTTPDRVLTYICDMSDAREEQRSGLFERWAASREDIKHYPAKASLLSITIYGGILTRHDFPYPDILQHELIDKAPGIVIDKFGR